MGKTKISWTDRTWNPTRGCARVSEGCRNCYAERQARRFAGPGQPYEGLIDAHGRWNGEARFVAEHLGDPFRWRDPQVVFVDSMSDLFHEDITDEQIAAVFGVMAVCSQHTFQILTKRPARMRAWFNRCGDPVRECIAEALKHLPVHQKGYAVTEPTGRVAWTGLVAWPLPNVWLGVSVEDQDAADNRIDLLLKTDAAVRFLSCEPLLGPINLRGIGASPDDDEDVRINALAGTYSVSRRGEDDEDDEDEYGTKIDWVIAGAESGPGARDCSVQWLRWLRDQCAEELVAFFLKQASTRGSEAVGGPLITLGANSRRKGGGIIELPYLDGEQHAAFPTLEAADQ
jgi:protein gp37